MKYDDPRLDSFANTVEDRYGLPPDLIVAVKNAGERSNTGQVSKSGAKGVMQFVDGTRKAYDHDYNDPMESIDAAGRYFSDLMKQYKGNVKAAVAHYNGGTKAGKAVLKGQDIPFKETRDYWGRLQGYMEKRANVPKDEPETPVASSKPPVATPTPTPPAMVAVAPKQERVLKYDAGGRRIPSIAEK